MIYDRVVHIYIDNGGTPLKRRLTYHTSHYCCQKEVYASRYWDSVQAGSRVDMLLQLRRDDSITGSMLAQPEDGHLYRIVQVQQTADEDGLPATVLSLQRQEDNFDIALVEGGAVVGH